MLKDFGDISARLARNPLGIIALAFVLVYGIAALLTAQANFQPEERVVLVWFLVLFPLIVLAVFYRLVSRHHDKLYAPSDFSNEEHFLQTIERKIEQSPKITEIEAITQKIKREVENQPLYRYTRLSEAGKQLILRAFNAGDVSIESFADSREQFLPDELEDQTNMLVDYGWLKKNGATFTLTDKSKREVSTFEDLCYGRWR